MFIKIESGQYPLFKRVIHPWYDTDIAYIIFMFFMLSCFAFAIMGTQVCLEYATFKKIIMLPIILVCMSGYILMRIITELVLRYLDRIEYE